jgi:hypothetical protein
MNHQSQELDTLTHSKNVVERREGWMHTAWSQSQELETLAHTLKPGSLVHSAHARTCVYVCVCVCVCECVSVFVCVCVCVRHAL